MRHCFSRMVLDLRTLGWGLHIERGGINPGNRRVHPRSVGLVDLRNDV